LIYAFEDSFVDTSSKTERPLHVKVVLSTTPPAKEPIKEESIQTIQETKSIKEPPKKLKKPKEVLKTQKRLTAKNIQQDIKKDVPIHKEPLVQQVAQEEKAYIDKEALKDEWLNALRQKIEKNLIYPLKAQKRKQEGSVEVLLVVKSNGDLLSFSLSKKSEFKSLDNASLELVQKIFPLTPFQSTLFGDKMEVIIPINYKLKEKK
jgi:protein TonB